MKKQKVYISGAISGRDREDYLKQFDDAEKHLRQLGYDVCNPTKALPCRFLWIYKLLGYKLTLIYDLWLLSRCNRIYMLSGSENSKGVLGKSCCGNIWHTKNLYCGLELF